jgi:hypothetical protein
MKLKSFYTGEETTKRVRRLHTEFIHLARCWYPEYVKNYQIKHQNKNYPINTWAIECNRHVSKEEVQMSTKYMEKVNLLSHQGNEYLKYIRIIPLPSKNDYHQANEW